ncbi:MAG: glycosyltransferase [bacterium]|nr:glycosyltransferase [bacterium]
MRILLTGGGTGGHIFPLVAATDELKKKMGETAEILYIGSGAAIERETMQREGISAKYILTGKMRRYFSILNLLDIFKVPIGFVQSLWILLFFMPDAVFPKAAMFQFRLSSPRGYTAFQF